MTVAVYRETITLLLQLVGALLAAPCRTGEPAHKRFEEAKRWHNEWRQPPSTAEIRRYSRYRSHWRSAMNDSISRLSRRRLIQLGGAGYLGLNLGGLLRAQAAGAEVNGARPIRACILLFYYGGPSHLDTYDLKPNAPAEVRGSFLPISTSVPGLQICEHLPRMARVMDKVAIVRSVHHNAHLHDSASIHALTGRPLEGPDRELFAPIPQVYPSFGSAFAYMNRALMCDVPFASLPYSIHNAIPTPCQGAGFLGSAYDPLLIDVDPTQRTYPVEALAQRDGVNRSRQVQRRSLLETMNHPMHVSSPLAKFYDKAFQLLESEPIHRAMDITQEPSAIRERYGFGAAPVAKGEVNGGGGEMGFARQMRGQNLLLARRLVEAGVPFVNVYDYKQQGANWDAHVNCANQHKSFLLPQADQALSALIEDLDQRGLLDSTLIVATGEFGRTPTINPNGGRDHWPHCYSVLLAGGGVQGGSVHGSSDKLGGHPATDPVTPGDIAATIFWRFGIDHTAELHDQTGRPHRITTGEPIRQLF
jgi:hypothetical protein